MNHTYLYGILLVFVLFHSGKVDENVKEELGMDLCDVLGIVRHRAHG